MQILIIDDEANIRRTTAVALEGMGHEAVGAQNSSEALQQLDKSNFDVAFLDLKLGEEQGLNLLPQLLEHDPALDVVVFTAYASIDSAVEAMRRGAFDYIPKPFTPDQIQNVLERVAHSLAAAPEPVWENSYELASRAAAGAQPVLLLGERGTGKTAMARFIHQNSSRAAKPLVRVCCPRLRPDRVESALFGDPAEPGDAPGTVAPGKLFRAEGGTLFLQEISLVPLAAQAKLLRVLNEGQYQRRGENIPRQANVRLIGASHHNLENAVNAGRFHPELFACLEKRIIHLPPLRERREELLKTAHSSLELFAAQLGKPVKGFSAEVEQALRRYRWPGNLRELQNVIKGAVQVAEGSQIESAHLPDKLRRPPR